VLEGKQGENAISGSLSTPLSADVKTQTIDLSKIAAAFTLPNPAGGTLKLHADGKAGIDLGKQTVTTLIKGALDDSKFDVKFGLTRFAPAAYTFDIGIDKLDLDRYRRKATAATAKAPDSPIDLSALKNLNAGGSVKIASLKLQNIKAVCRPSAGQDKKM